FGDNSRVLAWVFRRCEGAVDAVETPIGLVPADGDLDTTGLDITPEALHEVVTPDLDAMRQELPQVREHFARFERLPSELEAQLDALEQRLSA
ncbi:MAG TPA: phosphoenolpyruvate carboxykinase domain-containing protein, partial [Capillimicrobium sp.]